MTKKPESDLLKNRAEKQRREAYAAAMVRIATDPDTLAICVNDGAIFLYPVYTAGFLFRSNPEGKDTMPKSDQIAHDEICEQAWIEFGKENSLGRVSCTLQQTNIFAFLFRYFAENAALNQKEKGMKEAKDLEIEQSILISAKDYEKDYDKIIELEKTYPLQIARFLDKLVAEGAPADFWFDKGLLPKAIRRVYERRMEGNKLARLLFSKSDPEWFEILENSGHSQRKIKKALETKRKSYQKFILRRKKEKD